MSMKYAWEVLHQTSDFDAFQMLPRSILSLGMASWAGIVNANICSFPKLIRQHALGVVVVRTDISFVQPYAFFSGESFKVAKQMWLSTDRQSFIWQVSFLGAGGRPFATLDAVGRAVKIDPASWGAVPTKVESPILDCFGDDDFRPLATDRGVERFLRSIRGARPLAENALRKRIHRHECEAADQWSFVEIGANAASAREELLLECSPPGDAAIEVRGLLNRPLSTIRTLIKRPLFLFDHYTIQSGLYRMDGGYHVVHRYLPDMGRAKECAVVIESYDEMPGCERPA